MMYFHGDPLVFLDKGRASMRLLEEKTYDSSERVIKDFVFDGGSYGVIRFSLSLPKGEVKGLSTAIIVDGLDTGRKSLELIEDHGPYALIAFEYPEILRRLKGYSALFHIFGLRRAALAVPGQIAALSQWVQEQPWGKIPSIMGVSFGSEFVPALYHLAEKQEVKLGPAVLAYGGAGLFRLFSAFPGNRAIKLIRGFLGALVFRQLEPERHIPFMKGEFLVMNGIYDELIPRDAAERLQKLIPEPKTIVNLETPHLQPKSSELLQKLVKISRDWIEKRSEGSSSIGKDY
jgi:hypothetical protein